VRAVIVVIVGLLVGVLALSAISQAQVATGLPAAYGGGDLPAKVPSARGAIAHSTAIALVPSGDAMRIRLSIGLPCSGSSTLDYTSDDLLLRVPLAADGSFTGVQRVRSREFGSARVKITGLATPDRATGTIDVRTAKAKQHCRSGERPFVAKPVDVDAPLAAGGAPIPGALLVGLSSAKSSIPFGVVARIGSTSFRVEEVFTTQIAHCRAEGRRALKSRFTVDHQTTNVAVHLKHGKPTRTRTTSSIKERAGLRYREVFHATGLVTDAGLRLKWSETTRFHVPGYSERCTTGPDVLRAVPAA
jgi:hypothetical protein